jgi:hypothetical protein
MLKFGQFETDLRPIWSPRMILITASEQMQKIAESARLKIGKLNGIWM